MRNNNKTRTKSLTIFKVYTTKYGTLHKLVLAFWPKAAVALALALALAVDETGTGPKKMAHRRDLYSAVGRKELTMTMMMKYYSLGIMSLCEMC